MLLASSQELVQTARRQLPRLARGPPLGFHIAVSVVRIARLVQGPAATADYLAGGVVDDFDPVAGGVGAMPRYHSLRCFFERCFLVRWIGTVVAAEQWPELRAGVCEAGAEDVEKFFEFVVVMHFEHLEAHCKYVFGRRYMEQGTYIIRLLVRRASLWARDFLWNCCYS